MLGPLRSFSHAKHINHATLALNTNSLGKVIDNLATRLHYSTQDNKGCCKDVAQMAGKKVEPWPKPPEPLQPWRAECSQEPQPPNYDPYRIKVPDVVVPPLPPSNVKPMLTCANIKGPCSVKKVPPPPPCPPLPPPPFKWIYVWVILSFFGACGLVYKYYLWKEHRDKISDDKPVWRPRRKVKRPYHDRDLPPCVQYLIVGTGAAGWAAYRAIMQHDKTAKVFFITKEDSIPYKRPLLSKNMWFNADPPDPRKLNYIEDARRKTMLNAECRDFLDPVRFYRQKRGPALSIATGWCVSRVDAEDHVCYVRTMDGERPIYYERCLLAPGSKPKNLEVFKTAPKKVRDRVCTMRTVRDLEIAFRKVRESKHVTIIGGGTLGCELAWHLGRMNKVVESDKPPIEFVHIFKDKGILSGILPEYLGEWGAEQIKCEGVTLMPKTQVYDAFESADGRLELTLSNGATVVTDYAFVAIGAEPRVDMAEPSYLEQDDINEGFLVNTELEARTHLYVAGDAASFYSQWKDTRMRLENYINAEEQGNIAGSNMTGYWIPCNIEPNFWVKLGEHLEMEVVGEVGACMPIVGLFLECDDERAVKEADVIAGVRGDTRACHQNKTVDYVNRYKRGVLFYLRDETVVGFTFWNMPPIDDRKEVATELLRARPSYTEISMLAELLGFNSTRCVYEKAEEIKEIGPCIKNWKVW